MDSEVEEADETEQSLPPAVPGLYFSGERPSIAAIGRKRARDPDILSSSDPPLFSSDDLPPSLENYANKRKKRLYPGPWWGAKACGRSEHAVTATKRLGKLERALDSGVWMGSEDTDLSFDDGPNVKLVDNFSTQNPLSGGEDRITVDLSSRENRECSPQRPHSFVSVDGDDEPQSRADQVVQCCLEESIETVDLS